MIGIGLVRTIAPLLGGLMILGICRPAWGAEDFPRWLDQLRREAATIGVGAATIEAALKDVRPIPRVLALDRRQPEFTQSFWTYMDGRVSSERIARGRVLLKQHRGLLQKIRREYGVQPRFLVAFWGLESNFGDYTGGFPVISALATLAFDERRAAFFRTELLTALKILDQGHVSPQRMKGSWAGAMGQPQFLPSTFARFARDGDGDGKRDIWNSLPDVFASAANFLSRSGWKGDQMWGREVRLPQEFDYDLAGMETTKPLSEWRKGGIRRADGGTLPVVSMSGSVIVPAGHKGPAFLVYRNFRTTLVWNRSILYAVSVGHLADRLAGLPRLLAPRPAKVTPISRVEVTEMQRLLVLLGFDAGNADGIPGSRTRLAIRAFQRRAELPADGYPSQVLLQALRRAAVTTSGEAVVDSRKGG